MTRAGPIPRSTSPTRYGRATGSCRCCCHSEMACSPRSRGATRERQRIGSPNHRFQGVTKPGCFVSGELNNETAAAFKRDTHHDAAALFGDLKRTVSRPRLHRRHYPIPFPPAPSHRPLRHCLPRWHCLPGFCARRYPGACGETGKPQPFLSVALLSRVRKQNGNDRRSLAPRKRVQRLILGPFGDFTGASPSSAAGRPGSRA
jgi:hypothetical protein